DRLLQPDLARLDAPDDRLKALDGALEREVFRVDAERLRPGAPGTPRAPVRSRTLRRRTRFGWLLGHGWKVLPASEEVQLVGGVARRLAGATGDRRLARAGHGRSDDAPQHARLDGVARRDLRRVAHGAPLGVERDR